MDEQIRFHLDEHVSDAIARALRQRGVDVTTTSEAGLRTQDDTLQIAYARREQRALVTQDADFLRIAARDRTIGASFILHTIREPSVKSFAACF